MRVYSHGRASAENTAGKKKKDGWQEDAEVRTTAAERESTHMAEDETTNGRGERKKEGFKAPCPSRTEVSRRGTGEWRKNRLVTPRGNPSL